METWRCAQARSAFLYLTICQRESTWKGIFLHAEREQHCICWPWSSIRSFCRSMISRNTFHEQSGSNSLTICLMWLWMCAQAFVLRGITEFPFKVMIPITSKAKLTSTGMILYLQSSGRRGWLTRIWARKIEAIHSGRGTKKTGYARMIKRLPYIALCVINWAVKLPWIHYGRGNVGESVWAMQGLCSMGS